MDPLSKKRKKNFSILPHKLMNFKNLLAFADLYFNIYKNAAHTVKDYSQLENYVGLPYGKHSEQHSESHDAFKQKLLDTFAPLDKDMPHLRKLLSNMCDSGSPMVGIFLSHFGNKIEQKDLFDFVDERSIDDLFDAWAQFYLQDHSPLGFTMLQDKFLGPLKFMVEQAVKKDLAAKKDFQIYSKRPKISY